MTVIQNACANVPGFNNFYQRVVQRMVINGLALSTKVSYTRSLAYLALHFKKLPTEMSQAEIDEYLYNIKCNDKSVSENFFKFVIASLRFVFKMEQLPELKLQLPSIRKCRKIPTVLSKEEITKMMQIPCMLKHRVLIALLYGCGLRCSEVRKLKVDDIDFSRHLIHVRQAKGRKDRLMPLGKTLHSILNRYIKIEKPHSWLFPGQRWGVRSSRFFAEFDPQFGKRSILWAVKRAAYLAGINKKITVHCLRHTYATHMLENGVNLLTIKELMGHAFLQTTMIYLHVAQLNNFEKCTPLDKLENLRVIGFEQAEIEFPSED